MHHIELTTVTRRHLLTGVTRKAEVGTQVLAVALLPKAYFTSNRFQVTVALTPVILAQLRTVSHEYLPLSLPVSPGCLLNSCGYIIRSVFSKPVENPGNTRTPRLIQREKLPALKTL